MFRKIAIALVAASFLSAPTLAQSTAPGDSKVSPTTSAPTASTPSKKLTCSDRATNSSCWRCHKRGSGGERLEFDGVSQVCQAFDQACFLPVCGTTIEEIGAEILIHRARLEHVVDGGEDGGGDCDNGLLGTPPGFNAVVQGLQVATFLFDCRPGALHHRGLEPGSALAQAIGSTLAGTLVVARTDAGPRDEMWGRKESAHVDPDLGNDDVRADVVKTRNRFDQVDGGAKRLKIGRHLRVDLRQGGSEGVDLFEMKAQQEAMVVRHAATKRLAQVLR